MTTKYSVLMSIYFKENPNHFEECLNSILKQTILPDEIVLVKDGELTEELDKVIEEFKLKIREINLIIIQNEKNIGLGQSLNKGITYCKHELIARVDTDDINYEMRMQKQLEIFKTYPEIDICGTYIEEFITDSANAVSIRRVPTFNEDIKKKSKKKNPLNHMSVMFKKSKVLAAGNYEDVAYFEDYYLWLKMLSKGFIFYNIPEVLVSARLNEDFYSRRGGYQYLKKEFKFQKKIYNEGFSSLLTYISNVLIRCSVRLLPQQILKKLYIGLGRN